MRVSRRRRKVPAFIKIFITIIALAGVSLGAAYIWQNAEGSIISGESQSPPDDHAASSERVEPPPPPGQTGASEFESPYMASATASQVQAEKIKTASEAAAAAAAANPASDGDEPAESGSFAREVADGSVAASAAVDYNYFNDAIFFGDSISTGIPLYMQTLVPDAAVIAAQGVSPETASYAECINAGGTRVTMLDAAKTKGERKKVYIMLGANALDLEETGFMKGYAAFVQSVKEMYPSADIYVQSILPVTSFVNDTYPSKNINNTRISTYNDAIRKMAAGQGVWYVDVAQCMVDGDGYLPKEASPFDGMHLTPEYYMKWFDYLRTHTVAAKTDKGNDKK